MELSANFDFLQQEFPQSARSASYAEKLVHVDPRSSCFRSRHALESIVKRIYKVDRTLGPPPVQNLDGYLTGSDFKALIPEQVWQKAEYIRKAGNDAVHGKKAPKAETAQALVEELAHLLYWAGRTYLRRGAEKLDGFTYDTSLIPQESPSASPASTAELEALQAKLDKETEAREAVEGELASVREQLAANKAHNEATPDTHDYNEHKTRERIIDLALLRAGWAPGRGREDEYKVQGMPNASGVGYVDYVLWGDDGKPLAVVEAKKTLVSGKKGQQQAKLYADCMQQMHGQRPLIFYTNGYETYLWDDLMYPERKVAGFYKKDELASLIVRREQRAPLDVANINSDIAGRYYQKRAIGSIALQFEASHREALLVMATGTGKTRMAIALTDLLQRAGSAKRTLFLADRLSLVRQAASAFKEHLPDSSPVNLVTDKDQTGRVYVSTYPTMMGLIDASAGSEAAFSVGHFDLVVIDEAHRSVYRKYGAIFRYFDSLLVGLTATPREQVDKNTYELFGLEPGMPTDAYELETAVKDGFLVPPRVQQVDLRFPREGIDYDTLSEAEKEEWEGLDWGDDADDATLPERVNATAINSWLFNQDTVDKALKYLMEHGHKVQGGDRLAKTIIFARNHKHAEFIEARFNHHYPHYKGHFARIIDNYAKYPQSILDDFSIAEKEPHIAISVDMLDTGIDVPEVANLVFFKPVYSKIKFWQMIGRGTRLCPDLFGPGEDKQDFRVFDFCFNFDFFKENPDGIEGTGSAPLGTRLFRARVQLLGHVQGLPKAERPAKLPGVLTGQLHGEVSAMNGENFIVRERQQAVDRFRKRKAWKELSEEDCEVLTEQVAGLPSELETDDIQSRMFDLTALRMQLAQVQGDDTLFETARRKVVEIAAMLEEKTAIPAVKAQLAYLAALQETSFWEDIDLEALDEMRLRLRGLVPFLDKKARKIIYTNFQDEILSVREELAVAMPKMTGLQYEKKVKSFLANHLDHVVVHRLRTNQPLTETDLKGLETTLAEIGEDDGETLLADLLMRKEAPSLAHFVRGMVGMDRKAAQEAFATFLSDHSLTPPQIRFVEMVIDQLTARGIMDAEALYEAPFSDLHAGGPDALFAGNENVIDGIFEQLKAAHTGLG